jgi:RsiW-degrading membrane proteinase PrsW (M82 family)
MDYSMKIIVALAVPLIWLLFFRERETFVTPAHAVWLAILSGVLVTYPTVMLQEFLRTSPDVSFRWFYDLPIVSALTLDGIYARAAVSGIIYGGVIEESLKLVMALALFRLLRRSLRPWHLPILVLAVGCGFVMVENTLFYFNHAEWHHGAWLRSLSGVHVFYGAIMGSFLALGLMRRAAIMMFPAALIVPVLLHGTYNHAIVMNLAGGEVGVLARGTFLVIVLFSGLLALALTRHVARLAETASGNTADYHRAAHPWMRLGRWREWTWLSLAIFSGVLALAFLTFLGGIAGILEFKEALVLGVFAIFNAIVFGLRSREAAKAI